MMIASEQIKPSYSTYCCDVQFMRCNRWYSKVAFPFLFALMHAMFKYMSEPTMENNGVKRDIKIYKIGDVGFVDNN